ncbi:MAG: hypothetical protein V1716_01195 [Candidatus Uhrbacteria bacterium]
MKDIGGNYQPAPAFLAEIAFQAEKVKNGELTVEQFQAFVDEAVRGGVSKDEIEKVLVAKGVAVERLRPPVEISDLETIDGLRRLTIKEPSRTEIERISVEDTLDLMRKFRGLSFMMIHLNSFGEDAQAVLELKKVEEHFLASVSQIGLIIEAKIVDLELVKKSREKFILYLAGFLRFALPRITNYLLSSSKYQAQTKAFGSETVPIGLKNLVAAYLNKVG